MDRADDLLARPPPTTKNSGDHWGDAAALQNPDEDFHDQHRLTNSGSTSLPNVTPEASNTQQNLLRQNPPADTIESVQLMRVVAW